MFISMPVDAALAHVGATGVFAGAAAGVTAWCLAMFEPSPVALTTLELLRKRAPSLADILDASDIRQLRRFMDQFVSHGGDGFGSSQSGFPAAVGVAELILGTPEALSVLAQGIGNAAFVVRRWRRLRVCRH